MRPLFHPASEDIRAEDILHALADPVRATIFAEIARASCAQICAAFASVNNKPIPKSSLSQHFRVLREAGLIRSERQGVEMRNTSRLAEIETRFPGLLPAILVAYSSSKPTPKSRPAAKKRRAPPP
ncbi:MAG TPA: helix-turn-helix domain-containing protein [Hyphomonadaceae bacterium]|jgi:DNA-binding transcriptional ArsR family regulator|nr:helix-turn-helix domain-containing protein [Hyphomonadaceae bacterium]HPN04848.1 helix-turn-helix domain-containing protein [Hyphomonadaceae bacterium]